MMFPLGYYIINNFKKLKLLNNSIILMMVILIINFVISNYFGIGVAAYTDSKEFLTGNLADHWNTLTYSLLVTPLIIYTTRNRVLLYILSIVLLILLIVSLKRIAIFGLVFGYIIFFINEKKKKQKIIYGLTLIALTISMYPLYKSNLTKRFEARSEKLSNMSESIFVEGRYLETFVVWNETFSFDFPMKSLFGLQPFNSVGNYGNGSFLDRQIHVDYNLILNTTGIIGLILYLLLFIFIYKSYKLYKRQIINKGQGNFYFDRLNSVFQMLFLTQFITSISGDMWIVTFRSIIFIYLGAIIRQFKILSEENHTKKISFN